LLFLELQNSTEHLTWREDGVHSPVAASEAERVQVLWYVCFTLPFMLNHGFSQEGVVRVELELTSNAAVDHSLLSRYVLKPYWWSQVINIFPMSMAPNAVSVVFCCRCISESAFNGSLTLDLDHSLWFRLCHCKHCHYALLLSEHGPGLSRLGVLVLGYWSLLVPDFRCCGWFSGVSL
jgi:hypothetical protein